jgi:hypothetical protein
VLRAEPRSVRKSGWSCAGTCSKRTCRSSWTFGLAATRPGEGEAREFEWDINGALTAMG